MVTLAQREVSYMGTDGFSPQADDLKQTVLLPQCDRWTSEPCLSLKWAQDRYRD